MPDSFANYMKKEVVKYIKEELDKGIALSNIKKALLKGGHNHDLIEEAILDLLRHNFDLNKAMQEPLKSETLAQELYAEVLASLIDYIEFQKSQGYSLKEIKQILLNYGHSEEILDSAIKAVGQGSRSYLKNIKFIILSFLFVVFLLWVSSSTGDTVSRVLASFFPAIASLLIIGLMANRLAYRQLVFLWLLPFFFAGVFIVLGQSGTYDIFDGMKLYNLAVLNLIISVVFSIILISPSKMDGEPMPMADLLKKRTKTGQSKENQAEEVQEQPRMKIKEFRPA